MKHSSLVAIVSSLLLASAAAPSFAAAPETRPQRPGRASMAHDLGLTADQQSQLQKLRFDFRKEQISRRAEIQVARIEIGELMRAPQLDEKAIAAKAKVLSDLVAAQTRARIEHRLAMARVLTPEQREKAHGFMFDGGGRRFGHRAGGPGFGPGHGRGRGMGMGPWRHAPGPDGDEAAEN